MTGRSLRDKIVAMLGRRPPQMQVAALCIDPATQKVLLITSRGTGRWILPKGWPMAGRSLAAAAMQEAWEEGGVEGRVQEAEIGRYRYDKIHDEGFGVPVEVRVFPVRVLHLAEAFPEAGQRTRRWFTPAEAAERVDEDELKSLLSRLRIDAAGRPVGG
ncbi:MAG: NUDIX hydrolase [Paracoccus sp. (in: a-proteobacteria)]|nr:NUDIX hydrolase [Paracoccus sp. (in: a-proteobacteria)]